MRVFPVRRLPSRYQSPFILYFKGISRALLTIIILSIIALVYIFTAPKEIFYFSWVSVALVGISVLLGGLASGKDDKGWYYGGLVGATYGFLLLGINYYLIPGTLEFLSILKYFGLLSIIGSVGGSAGFHLTLTKARYNLRNQGMGHRGKGRVF